MKIEHNATHPFWDNVMAFWELTGDKYKTLGQLMESPEGIEVRKLWSGDLVKKYPTFSQFIASPEAAPLRERYRLEPGKMSAASSPHAKALELLAAKLAEAGRDSPRAS